MEILDLQKMRCPMSLITLKRHLLLHNTASGNQPDSQLRLLFSNQQAAKDITLYLDKKMYDYSIVVNDNQVILVMQTNTKNLY